MDSSGVDMMVFKEYGKPVEKEQVIIKPIMAKLGPIFKGEAGKIAELFAKADPVEVETSFKKNGYHMLGNYKILPEHVDISRQKTVERGRRFIPHVIEPSFGIDRLFYIAMEYAYQVKEDRAVMGFPCDIAPVQVGVFPLMSKDDIPEKTLKLHKMLLDEGFVAEYDEAGSIGRRYARADEAGIPLGITLDYDTLKDDTVTVRHRDSWKQVRTPIKALPDLLHSYFRKKLDFEDIGKPI
jgi:glycyl-tRNA synthetase